MPEITRPPQLRPQMPHHAGSLQASPLNLPRAWRLEPSARSVIPSASPFSV